MNTPNKQVGQGLIEMMIVLVFIAVGVIAMVKFQNSLAYHSADVSTHMNAMQLANNQLEKLRDYVVLTTQTGYPAYSDITNGSTTATSKGVTYTITWAVQTNTTPAYKTVDVTVSWSDRYGVAQSLMLSSRIASIDPAAEVNLF